MTRRSLLLGAAGQGWAQSELALPFRLLDVTRQAGIDFQHNTGGFGQKYLPETMGPGCAFLDYDGDGWQDILLINGADWPGHKKQRSTMALYRNNRNGTFTDVTREAGLDIEMYGLGVAIGDYNNDGYPDLYVTAMGQSRLFQNNGKGKFSDVTARAGLGGREAFSTSALWFDYNRDGLLDLFVCNYVRWTLAGDVYCSLDGLKKSYCTPEAYRGSTCWLFRNRGDGTFEDVTAKSGLFDSTSKSLGVALLDYDQDGWPDLIVANDTQPNKLYRNQRDGTFTEVGVKSGLAFSDDGKARAGMGVDVGDLDGSGLPSIAITNFDNEMLGLYRGTKSGEFRDLARESDIGKQTRRFLGFGCLFLDVDLDGRLDLLVVNGHIDPAVSRVRSEIQYAQPTQLFLNQGAGKFREVAGQVGSTFVGPRVGRGAAYGDFDNDGDLDILLTTNSGGASLYRNDVRPGTNSSVRVRLVGVKSNKDAIGTSVNYSCSGLSGSRMVKSGSSYLSQSELPLTFGIGRNSKLDRISIAWASGRVEEHTNLLAGGRYVVTEGKGLTKL